MTTILITHKIDEAEQICNKILIMAEGKLKALDTPQRLKQLNCTSYMIQVDVKIINNDNVMWSVNKVDEII